MRMTTLTYFTPMFLAMAVAAGQPMPNPSGAAAPSSAFWGALNKLGFVFKSMGSLSGGVERGAVWIVDLRMGERRRVGQSQDLAWPVLAPDGAVFALRGRQVVKLVPNGAKEEPVGGEADWRKLLAVTPEGSILGFVAAKPRAQPAMMMPDGGLTIFPQPETDQERRNASILLQEERDDREGRRLEVRRSERGGRGFDVFLTAGKIARNLSDCRDDACGQPSFSPDGNFAVYVRAPTR